MDVIALVIGFAFGVIVVVLAIEIGMKKTSRVEPAWLNIYLMLICQKIQK